MKQVRPHFQKNKGGLRKQGDTKICIWNYVISSKHMYQLGFEVVFSVCSLDKCLCRENQILP